MMKRLITSALLALSVAGPALAADITNGDAERQTITIMEAGGVSERSLDPGEQVDVCQNGCIVAFPDGSQMALSGMESVEIRNGAGHLD
ncbi:MAG: hypothetical protein L0I29_15100 [Hyphomicrobiales bacterium]|nr:hypothetical protein [Hyphomicrobiales bacterium]